MEIPSSFDTPLSQVQLDLLKAFTKACRHSIVDMTTRAQSGHPGGSLSCLDYLAVLYAFVISQTGEDVVVSNGHISPGVYGVLAEMGYIPKKDVIEQFRKMGSIYEGHITRHVPGIEYGTGPLGIGVSVATGFALAQKIKKQNRTIYGLMGDGEAQEGQVYEMIQFAKKYQLNNFVLFVDYNKVQLTASLKDIMPTDILAIFKAGGFEVLECDAHDYNDIWRVLGEAKKVQDKPIVIIGNSIMGKGVELMEEAGAAYKSTWHGSTLKPDQAEAILEKLTLSHAEENLLTSFRAAIRWQPNAPYFPKALSFLKINIGTPLVYTAETLTDCRTAYGKALFDLAKLNPEILAITADLGGSVMTKFVQEEIPKQHFECGIAEQHMVSLSGGLSLKGFIPFCSTFGAFLSSRAKDQARVNDINQTNVKMVATHCGLSVGEDGPTHQAIDDMGSFLGLFNTMVIEPADPNQTDRIIRYIASHFGNFYVRMGRHKFPILTKEDGSPFFDENYQYVYGQCDLIRPGEDLTIAAMGAMVGEAFKAREELSKSHPDISVEIVAVSSLKQFDETLLKSIQKTQKIITLEDHNPYSGLGSQVARWLASKKIGVQDLKMMGVEHYQLSGKWNELYQKAGLSIEKIIENVLLVTSPGH
ncbi:MAG: transketolase, transketolase [Candidatus Peregrinibacteria bacterium GW2011_GWF2_39_17]|nr:MAG: transketolase, transketolase [Candidatus Peregrinibacteria bacterium GW2011_GWF2_39_17]